MNENMNKEQGSQESPPAFNNGQKPWMMHGHGMCCGHRHFWLRWLLGLIILAAVFCVGVKVGEFKGEFGRGFGGYRGHQMMRYYPQQAYPLSFPSGRMMVVPNTATTTPAK
jgi:hypothetical protein